MIARTDNAGLAGLAQTQAAPRIPITTVGMALSSFLAASFVLCVAGYLLFPTLPITHSALSIFLPGFTLLNWASFFLGLVESIAWGWYIAAGFGLLYNFFASLHGPAAD